MSKYQVFRSKYLVLKIQYAENLIAGFLDRNPRFLIEILGLPNEILGVSEI